MVRGKKHRWLIVAGVFCIVTVATPIVVQRYRDPLYRPARREWKDQAIKKIEQRLADTQWLNAELATLKASAAARPGQGGWAGEELLLAKNGDWIVCQSICNKQDSRIKDIFIGRASDGKWYYSTFHFCVGKCVLRIERQPTSLAQLVDAYWLVPFDGRSDECLKTTWTGAEPWGEEKIQAGAADGRKCGQAMN